MDLSIIIVNWNGGDLIRRCLQSIEDHASDLKVQTMVVDNNSSDGSVQLIAKHFPKVQLLRAGGNIGFGRANNLGLRETCAEFVLFLNPDTEVRPGSLHGMIAWLRNNPRTGMVQCRLVDRNGTAQELGIQWFPSPWTELVRYLFVSANTRPKLHRILPSQSADHSGFVRKLYGACLMSRRELMQGIGGFDERFFMYCEDVDLCQRVRKLGWQLYYLSNVDVMHIGGGTSHSAPSQFSVVMTCESLFKLMYKHYGLLGAWMYRCIAVSGSMFRLAVAYSLVLLSRCHLGSFLPEAAQSIHKHKAILGWALGIRRPEIGGGEPSHHSQCVSVGVPRHSASMPPQSKP